MFRALASFGSAVVVSVAVAAAGPAEEREAEAALQKLGGKVVRVGLDDAKPVFKVEFFNPKLTDDDLKAAAEHLAVFPELKVLHLGGRITDKGLAHVAGLKTLEEVSVFPAGGITDKGLPPLKKLTSLKRLDLVLSKVTDAGVADLKKALPGVKVTRRVGEGE